MASAEQSGAKLESWKAIAVHMGRDVRTVQRWERHEGLPVHRLQHQKRGSVYAFTHELDAWTEARRSIPKATPANPVPKGSEERLPAPVGSEDRLPARPLAAHRGWRWTGMATAGFLAVTAAVLWFTRPASGPGVAPAPRPATALDWQRLFTSATADGGHWRLVPAGTAPAALVLAAGGRELYAGDEAGHAIAAIDTAGPQPLAALPLLDVPSVLAATTDGSTVYAAGVGGGLDIIDTGTRHIARLTLGAAVVASMVLTPDNRTLYLAEQYDGLARLDLATHELTHIATAACPSALALAPGGRTLYVGYQCGGPGGRPGHDAIGVYDTVRQRFSGTIAGNVPMVASVLAVTPDGNELWSGAGPICTPGYDLPSCPPGVGSFIYVFDTTSGRLLSRIPLPDPPHTIAFLTGGSRVLVDGQVVDATRREVLSALPAHVYGVASAPGGKRVFLALAERHAVAVFDTPQNDCSPPAADLSIWWPGDGSTADAWGQVAGTATPGLRYAPGRAGQGFAFDGKAVINFGHGERVSRPWREGVTFAAWIKPLAPAPGTLFTKEADVHGTGWRWGLDNQTRLRVCFAATCVSAATALPLGQWHHVAVSAGAEGVNLYLDGRLAAHGPLPPGADAPAADLIAGTGFHGIVDDIVVYSHALDAAALAPLVHMPACVAAVR